MLRKRDRWLVGGSCTLLFLIHLFIFASIPGELGGGTRAIVVKKGTKLPGIAAALKDDHLVSSSYLFLLCSLVLYRGRVVAGEYELDRNLSILDIAKKMAAGRRKIYTLRVIEGYNLLNAGDAMEKAGIMKKEAFLSLAQRPEFLKKLGIPSDSLEGYLAPDTYFFSKETDVEEFVERIVQRTFKVFEREDIRKRMAELHTDMYQVLSVASMIEKEAKLEEEKPLISAVFHNRLRLGMSLDSDPTVTYGLGSFHRNIRKADLAAYTAYNTYRLKGLPKGPICNPSKGSVMAALYPASSDFLYFVSRNDGSHAFSRSIQEHNHFVAVYQKSKGRK